MTGFHIGRTERRLSTMSTTTAYAWYTSWLPAIGMDSVKGVLQNRNHDGNFQSRLAVQTAAVREDNPDAPTTLEAGWLGNSERCTGVVDLTSYTGPKMLVRLGVAYNLSTGSNLGSADTHLELTYNNFGRIVTRKDLRLHTPDTANYYEPLTGFLPAVHVAKAKASLVITDASANLQTRLAWRAATIGPQSPGSWSTTWDTWHSSSGEFATGELTPSVSTDMFIQIGLQHSMTSGTHGVGLVHAVVAVRPT